MAYLLRKCTLSWMTLRTVVRPMVLHCPRVLCWGRVAKETFGNSSYQAQRSAPATQTLQMNQGRYLVLCLDIPVKCCLSHCVSTAQLFCFVCKVAYMLLLCACEWLCCLATCTALQQSTIICIVFFFTFERICVFTWSCACPCLTMLKTTQMTFGTL